MVRYGSVLRKSPRSGTASIHFSCPHKLFPRLSRASINDLVLHLLIGRSNQRPVVATSSNQAPSCCHKLQSGAQLLSQALINSDKKCSRASIKCIFASCQRLGRWEGRESIFQFMRSYSLKKFNIADVCCLEAVKLEKVAV